MPETWNMIEKKGLERMLQSEKKKGLEGVP